MNIEIYKHPKEDFIIGIIISDSTCADCTIPYIEQERDEKLEGEFKDYNLLGTIDFSTIYEPESSEEKPDKTEFMITSGHLKPELIKNIEKFKRYHAQRIKTSEEAIEQLEKLQDIIGT